MTVAIFLLMVGVVGVAKGWKGWSLNDILTGERTPPKQLAGSSFDITTLIPSFGTDAPATEGAPPMGNDAAATMYSEADRITKLKLPYKWGGGHESTPPPSNGPFDCSGFVSRVLDAAGALPGHRPQTSGQLMTYGKAGQGKYVTIYANPAHTFLVINGRTVGTGHLNRGGPEWQDHTTAGFVARHPDGL